MTHQQKRAKDAMIKVAQAQSIARQAIGMLIGHGIDGVLSNVKGAAQSLDLAYEMLATVVYQEEQCTEKPS
jgi:nitrogen-specific signal transduction histidine kinase